MSKGKKDPDHKSWKELSLKEKLSTLLASAIAIVAVSGIGGGYLLNKAGDMHDNGVEKDITAITEQFAGNKEDVCSWDAQGIRVRDWKGEIVTITRDALDEMKPDSEGIVDTFRRISTSYEPDKDIFRDRMQQLADRGIGICFDSQLPPDMPSAYYPEHKLITLSPQAPDDQLVRLLAAHLERLSDPSSPDTQPVGLLLENNTAEPQALTAPEKLPPAPLRGRAISPA